MNALAENTPPRLLLIEDDKSVVRMLRISLRDAGFEVTEASTGEAALQVLDQQHPDAVVLDLGLLDDRAGAVLDQLRSGNGPNPTSTVWVVISALDAQEASLRYGDLREHFLAKPFDPWVLVERLRQELRV